MEAPSCAGSPVRVLCAGRARRQAGQRQASGWLPPGGRTVSRAAATPSSSVSARPGVEQRRLSATAVGLRDTRRRHLWRVGDQAGRPGLHVVGWYCPVRPQRQLVDDDIHRVVVGVADRVDGGEHAGLGVQVERAQERSPRPTGRQHADAVDAGRHVGRGELAVRDVSERCLAVDLDVCRWCSRHVRDQHPAEACCRVAQGVEDGGRHRRTGLAGREVHDDVGAATGRDVDRCPHLPVGIGAHHGDVVLACREVPRAEHGAGRDAGTRLVTVDGDRHLATRQRLHEIDRTGGRCRARPGRRRRRETRRPEPEAQTGHGESDGRHADAGVMVPR